MVFPRFGVFSELGAGEMELPSVTLDDGLGWEVEDAPALCDFEGTIGSDPEGQTRREKTSDRIAQPVPRREERLDPLIAVRVRQGQRPPRGRGSCAALAFVQETLAILALKPLGLGLLRAFDRLRRLLCGVALRSGEGIQPRRPTGRNAAGRAAAAHPNWRDLGKGVSNKDGVRSGEGKRAGADQGRDSHQLEIRPF